ncbi:MAG: hypothetical protein EOO43_05385, partial [Flavobacterium sp.]
MNFEEKLSKLLHFGIENQKDLVSPEFKIMFERLFIDHCSLENISNDEMRNLIVYKNRIWDDILKG